MVMAGTGLRIQVLVGIVLCVHIANVFVVHSKPIHRRNGIGTFVRPHHPGRRPAEMTPKNEDKVWKFMRKYGYIDDTTLDSDFKWKYNDGKLYDEVYTLQKFMGLSPTGEIDDATLEQMDEPRCGFPDKGIVLHRPAQHESDRSVRQRRYIVDGGRWEQDTITYRIVNSPAQIPLSEVRPVIQQSFDIWKEHIPRVFEEVTSGQADIYLSFKSLDHGDDLPFDGPGGTYAHAFGPQLSEWGDLAGDVHFDDSEDFRINNDIDGINLHWVASHEIGHSLGLGHSDVFGSLMWPYYGQFRWNGALNYDDRLGIQAIYISTSMDNVSDVFDSSLLSSESSSTSQESSESDWLSTGSGDDTSDVTSSDTPLSGYEPSSDASPSSLDSDVHLHSSSLQSEYERSSDVMYSSTSSQSDTSSLDTSLSDYEPSSDDSPLELSSSLDSDALTQGSSLQSEYERSSDVTYTSSSSQSDTSSLDTSLSEYEPSSGDSSLELSSSLESDAPTHGSSLQLEYEERTSDVMYSSTSSQSDTSSLDASLSEYEPSSGDSSLELSSPLESDAPTHGSSLQSEYEERTSDVMYSSTSSQSDTSSLDTSLSEYEPSSGDSSLELSSSLDSDAPTHDSSLLSEYERSSDVTYTSVSSQSVGPSGCEPSSETHSSEFHESSSSDVLNPIFNRSHEEKKSSRGSSLVKFRTHIAEPKKQGRNRHPSSGRPNNRPPHVHPANRRRYRLGR